MLVLLNRSTAEATSPAHVRTPHIPSHAGSGGAAAAHYTPPPPCHGCKPVRSLPQVAFNAPNCVGYLRLALLAAAAASARSSPQAALYLLLLNFALDAADGALARRLQQVDRCAAAAQLAALRPTPRPALAKRPGCAAAPSCRPPRRRPAAAAAGCCAPRMQASAFGAVLDVLVDNATRGLLWVWSLGAWGLPPVLLEMAVFAFTHKVRAAAADAQASQCAQADCRRHARRQQAAAPSHSRRCLLQGGGLAWKEGCFTQAPRWVRAVMAGGLRSPAGGLAVAGLVGAPLWAWARRSARLPGAGASA
jgi:hypothetical protein